jgi:hypothetical protein
MAIPEHLDYADEAESAERAERAEAWPQALALWQRAIATCPGDPPDTYAAAVARCQRQIDVDAELASIARRVMRIPTLDARNSDRLDFHEVSVWELLSALRLAYRAGQTSR